MSCTVRRLLQPAAMAVWASAALAGDLSELSLEELLRLRVVTPAATEQTAAESPAVVSVLTAEQIRELGVTTLYEALSYLPGVALTESYFGYTMVNVRGLLQTHYNNKVLMMVDGHPTREVTNGSYHLEIVPVDAIERIEFVRGPGSALYGTNAFAGVINVITRKGGAPGSRSAAIGFGSFATTEASAVFGGAFPAGDYLVAAGMRQDSGYPYRVDADERGRSGTIDYENDVVNALAAVTYKGLTLTAAVFDQDKQKFGVTPVLSYGGVSSYRGALADALWRRELGAGLSLSARLRYDTMDRDSIVSSFPFDGFQGHADADNRLEAGGDLFGAELNVGYAPSKALSLLGGVVHERRHARPYVWRFVDDGTRSPFTAFNESQDAHDTSVYAQGLVRLSPRTEAVLGFRFNSDSDAGSSFLPRVGLVHRLAARTYLKALYAEGFRAPDFFEKHAETYNVLYGDPQLEPERTRSFDLALDTRLSERLNLQVNAFYITTDDMVVRRPTPDPERTGPGAAVYVNSDGERIVGIETGVIAQPFDRLRVFGNYSYREAEARDSGADNGFVENHTLNAGLTWRVLPSASLSPSVQYVGERGAVDSHTLLNAVLSIRLAPGLDLRLIGRNLTDEDYAYPEYIRRIISETPGGPGRAGYARLHWRL